MPCGWKGQCGSQCSFEAASGAFGLFSFLFKRWQAYHRRKCATVNSTSPDRDLFTFSRPGFSEAGTGTAGFPRVVGGHCSVFPACHAIRGAGGDTLLYISLGAVRPLVPEKNRISVFKQIHGIAHARARATQRLIAARFVWPKMLRTFDSGFEIARIVHVPRCSGTHTLHLSPFSCPGGSSLTSMLTW
jgi:hypothetical protein